ncbi:MAG: TVP38/TMEM64 family protein [Acidobacteriales bacterium]|nr:TVP38/TMEM64 family protein [Terriglobales bacterium]
MSRNARFRIAGLIGAIAIFGLAAWLLPFKHWIGLFLEWVRGFGTVGALVYATVYVAGTVFLIPGTALTAGAGLLYGPVIGTLIVSPASVLGATLAFLIGRHFARDWVETRLSGYPKFAAIDQAIGKSGFKVVLLLRLQPVFIPFAFLNYALGLTKVRLRDYVLASWMGMLPASILYVYLGSAVHNIGDLLEGKLPHAGPWGHVLFWGGLGATFLLVLLLGRMARKALREQLEPEATAQRSIA